MQDHAFLALNTCFFSFFHEVKILYNDKGTQTHPTFLNHYYRKTVTIIQRQVFPDIHLLYSIESLRSII